MMLPKQDCFHLFIVYNSFQLFGLGTYKEIRAHNISLLYKIQDTFENNKTGPYKLFIELSFIRNYILSILSLAKNS